MNGRGARELLMIRIVTWHRKLVVVVRLYGSCQGERNWGV